MSCYICGSNLVLFHDMSKDIDICKQCLFSDDTPNIQLDENVYKQCKSIRPTENKEQDIAIQCQLDEGHKGLHIFQIFDDEGQLYKIHQWNNNESWIIEEEPSDFEKKFGLIG